MALLGAIAPAPGATADTRRVDRILAPWSGPGKPGCALAVVQQGRTVFARGYGRANLELDVPITPHSVFDIGSVAKQFTALAVLLLAQDGKLSLDDEIRAFLPELPPYPAPIRLRHLLHHQSGLPSYTDLFDLAGVPEIDLTTDDDALALIARQRAPAFAPGHEFLYSDTNYFLLSLVVRRVSGLTLRDFARQRIFEPLGMRRTHFHDDHRQIVPGRATGYAALGDSYAIEMSNFEQLGDGALLTTVEDLARWDRNFDSAQVGGRAVLAQLQEPGRRADGTATPYAMGLLRDTYRGLPRLQHSGQWVGYQSAYLRFERPRLSVILLCNQVGAFDALGMAEQIADRYLDLPDDAAPAALPAQELDALAGDYFDAPTLSWRRFVRDGATLVLQDGAQGLPLRHLGARTFAAGNSTTRFVFAGAADAAGHAAQPAADHAPELATQYAVQRANSVRVESDDFDPLTLARSAAPAARTTTDPAPLAGGYDCAALGATWTLQAQDGRLVRRQPLLAPQPLQELRPDLYSGELSEGRYTLQFTRDAGQVDGFLVATSMVRPLRCARRADGASR